MTSSSPRRPMVVGNWKMHGTLTSARTLLQALKDATRFNGRVDVAVCPPFVHLALCREFLTLSGIRWGAQDVCQYPDGAYTGEVSAAMLADLGCSCVLVSHSERRSLFGESDAIAVAKLQQALAAGLTPILCVGETLAEREAGTATPDQAQAVHAFIRGHWRSRQPAQADQLVVLYGGSVKADNAALLFAQPDVDGGLVGGAALDPVQFCAIVNAAEQAWNH